MLIEMLAARNGDCLILHYGTPKAPGLILIDGGPAGIWEDGLRPRLMQLRTERGLTDNDPLIIDLLIVSHVDDDHINGVAKLLQAIADGRRDKERLFAVRRIWHNTFDSILGNDETASAVRSKSPQFGGASGAEEIETSLRLEPAGARRDAAFVLASMEQGAAVRRLAKALDIPINPGFPNRLVQAAATPAAPIIVGELELTIVGPLHDELAALQSAHDKWLHEHPEFQNDATAMLSALDDKSVANLSSITILVRSGANSLLLTGDARLDKVLEGLKTVGALNAEGTLELDILKMPHHGSIRNVDADTLRRLPARHYLFSGDGKFGNPDRATFALLLDVRPAEPMDFVTTYSLERIEEGRKRDRAKKESGRKSRAAKRTDGNPKSAMHRRKVVGSGEDDSLLTLLSPPPVGVTVTASKGISISIATSAAAGETQEGGSRCTS